MATNFPTSYDNATTHGGPFIDVSAPVDPQRNIAAVHRNNLNDIVVAIENKLGFTGETTDTTVDWALLTVGGVPNQGLRFASSNAQWPALVAEDGLFIDTATGDVAFHKSGDAVGVFSILTSSSNATWDTVYAADKTLDINSTALIFDQSDTSNTGFLVQRSVDSSSPLMQISTLSATDNGIALYITNASTSALHNVVYIESVKSDIGLLTYFDTTTSIDRLSITARGVTVFDILAPGPANAPAFRINVTEEAGDFQAYLLDLDSADVNVFRFFQDGTLDIKSLGGEPINGSVTSPGGTSDFVGSRMVVTSGGVTASSALLAGHQSDMTAADTADTDGVISGFNAKLSGTKGSSNYAAYYTEGSWNYGLFSLSPAAIQGVAGTSALQVVKSTATELIADFADGNLTSSTSRWTIAKEGDVVSTPDDPTAPFDAHSITMTSGGLDNETMRGLLVDLTTNAGDLNSTPIWGVDLQVTDPGGSSATRAINIGANWDFGIRSASPVQFDSTLTIASQIDLGDDIPLNLGALPDSTVRWSTVQTNDGLVWGFGDTSRSLIIAENADAAADFAHANAAVPTVFVHSVLAPTTDTGEYLGLSYLGLSAGTMNSDRATYDFTVKSSNSLPGASSNQTGGKLILEGGTGETATDGGIVQIGSSFSTSHSLDSESDLGIAGDLEVDGFLFADGATIANTVLADDFYVGGGSSGGGITFRSDDGTIFVIGSFDNISNHHLILTSSDNFAIDHDHDVKSTHPTVFLHSALSPTTDNSEYIGWSYLGFVAGTMETDRATFDFTLKASSAFASATGGNRNAGDLVLEGGTGQSATFDGIVKTGTASSTSHSLDSSIDLLVGGELEVGGLAFLDGNAELPDNGQLFFGASQDVTIGWFLTQTNDSLGIGLGDTSRTLIIAEKADITTDFVHANASDPTVFVHSVLSPTTDTGEYLGLSYLGLQAGTMSTDRAPFDVTIQASSALPGAITNTTGGDLILKGGEGPAVGGKVILEAGASGGAGVVQVGSGFTANNISANIDLGVAGEFEVSGVLYAENDITMGGSARTLNLGEGGKVYFGGSGDAQMVFTTGQVNDSLIVSVGNASRTMIVAKNDSGDFDHADAADPTVFVHSVLSPVTDNGEYLGLSYLGLQAGQMETDRLPFDITIKAVDAASGASVANDDGGDLILEGGAGDGSGLDGFVKFNTDAQFFGSAIFGSNVALFEDDVGLSFGGTTSVPKTHLSWNMSQSPENLVWGLDDTSGSLVICHYANIVEDYGHGNESDPTIFLHSQIDPVDNGEYLGWSYLGFTAGTMSTNRSTYDLTIKASSAYASASTEVSGGDLILAAGDGKTDVDDGTVLINNSTKITSNSTRAQQALAINQLDTDQAFIDFQGQSSANQTDSISTSQGAGVVVGPKDQDAAEEAWDFSSMIQIEINGSTYWMAVYTVM